MLFNHDDNLQMINIDNINNNFNVTKSFNQNINYGRKSKY